MTNLLKLKFVFSVLLLLCLFLPLSQCTVDSASETNEPTKEVVQNQYVFESPTDPHSWIHALAFVAPFIVLLITRKNRHKIRHSLVLLLLSGAAVFVVFGVTLLSDRLLFAGYLAYASSVSLGLLALIELWLNVRNFMKARSAQQP